MNIQLHFTVEYVLAIIAGVAILNQAEVIELHCRDLSGRGWRHWDSGAGNISTEQDDSPSSMVFRIGKEVNYV